MTTSKNFALVGAAGFVAARHMRAIRDTGNKLVATVDPHDNVGVIDSYFPDARFFTQIERFDRHLEKLRRKGEEERVHYLSVCSPNYLHDAHVRLALRTGAHAICEKPLVINPWNLDQLTELEAEHDTRIYTVLQLRMNPNLIALRERILAEGNSGGRREIELTYITRRGSWYLVSWKGDQAKSGGLAMNLGVHFFDVLGWIFGPAEDAQLHLDEPQRMAGVVLFPGARVRWYLSCSGDDLPPAATEKGLTAWRTMRVDGEEIEFSGNFTDLHTRVYEDLLAGGGYGIEDARPSIELIYKIRNTPLTAPGDDAHPLLKGEALGGAKS
ncbi:MAG: Gfo/Idh/MocA family oxidoreductase [Planctomycetes bacterium]|nr:Gfo/Idh/MocA family oxidoreductase [Planctomycetota bacterium]